MPVNYTDEMAAFSGNCRIEDAEALREWLESHPDGKIDLRTCEHLHTALLQILLVAKPPVSNLPDSPFFNRWLISYLR